MDKKEQSVDTFPNTDVQTAEVTFWSSRYNQLLADLEMVGSEIRVVRILETDNDIAPGHFVRDAVHHFIFPKQKVSLYTDQSDIIDATPGYELQREAKYYSCDSERVTGMLQISYDDTETRIRFKITDLYENSNLPIEAKRAINRALSEPTVTS